MTSKIILLCLNLSKKQACNPYSTESALQQGLKALFPGVQLEPQCRSALYKGLHFSKELGSERKANLQAILILAEWHC